MLGVTCGLWLLFSSSTVTAWHDTYHDLAPDWPDYLDVFKDQLRHPREEPGLQFPPLSAKQKQFAVNPGHPEFYRDHPDFLQFRLQALDDSQSPYSDSRDGARQGEILERELEAVLGMGGGSGLGVQDIKRARLEPQALPLMGDNREEGEDAMITTIIAATTCAAVFAVVGVGYCYHRASRGPKEGEETEYPTYGVTGPAKEASPAGDRKLAQSAQMYHYQHQKNQMIGHGRGNGNTGNGTVSGGEESEGEGEEGEGDYTVYECPGLASTDEMEVKNPLFNDDPTPKNP